MKNSKNHDEGKKRKSVNMAVDDRQASHTDEAVIHSTADLDLQVASPNAHANQPTNHHHDHMHDARPPKGTMFSRAPNNHDAESLHHRHSTDTVKTFRMQAAGSTLSAATVGTEKWNHQSISTYYDPTDLLQEDSLSEVSSVESIDISTCDNSDLTDTEYNEDEDCNRKSYIRNMYAFMLLGLCHKMTYNMTVAASRDILYYYSAVNETTGRACVYSDWSFVLSEAIPGFFGKFVGMFIPLYPRFRTILVCLMSIIGCLCTSTADNFRIQWLYLVGVGVSAFSGVMGEALYLSTTTRYDYSTITAFSSGTGYGSLIAVVMYVVLRWCGLEVSKILVLNLPFIAIECCAFFVILRPPCKRLARPAHHNLEEHEPLVTPAQKWRFIPKVLPFMLPYTIQNFAQYLIMRGATPQQIYGNEGIMPFFQTTFLFIAYTVGNMITRAFGGVAERHHLWLLACLQVANCLAMWMEVRFSLLPHLWQALIFTLWVGLVSGSSYLNTHYLITKQQPSGTRQFSLNFTAFGEQLALSVALIILLPIGNTICDVPLSRPAVRLLMFHHFG